MFNFDESTAKPQRILIFLLLLLLFYSCKSSEEEFPKAHLLDLETEIFAINEKPQVEIGELKEEYYEAVLPGTYRLKKGDRLEIMVEGQPDTLIADNLISPNGNLYYLMCAPFKADNMTLDELRGALKEKLSRYFSDPQVYISVQERSENQYYLMGKVRAPGIYTLDIPTRLREAISVAGGLSKGLHRGEKTSLASLKNSYIIREGKKLPIDFKKLIMQADFSENIYLRPNDYIYIASNMVEEVYVLGNVQRSRAFYYKDDLSLMKVLSSVNYALPGDQEKVVILRGRMGDNRELIEVDVGSILTGQNKDVLLQADDLIFVPEKPYYFAKELMKTAMRAFVGAFSSDAARYIATEELYE